MRRLKYISLALLGIILSLELWAQPITVPGYRGKKFSLTASYSGSPWLNQEYRNNAGIPLGWNNRANLGLDIVTGRPTSIGFVAHYHRTWFRKASVFGNAQIGVRAYGPSAYLRLHPFGRKSYLAPVGNYIQIELNLLVLDAYDRYEVITPAPSTRHLGTFFMPFPSVTLGHNHIFFHRMMLSYGLQGSLRLFGPTTIVKNAPDAQIPDIAAATASRGYGPYIFNVHLGVGCLLF